MKYPLSIEEQKRLANGHVELVSAIARVVKAQNDYDMFKSNNYLNNLRAAMRKLKEVGIKEKAYIDNKQNEIF